MMAAMQPAASVSAPAELVRLADRNDEAELIDMVCTMHPEAALRTPQGAPIPLDVERVRMELHRAIIPNRNTPDLPAWIGVVGAPGRIIASVYLSMETVWYSGHIILVERWLYVRPEFRKSNLAATLINFSKISADAVNARPLIVGHMSAGREEAKTRFYRRHLGEPMGAYFSYNGPATVGAL